MPDDHMRKWLEQQQLSSLTTYKVDIVEEAHRHTQEHGFKLRSGNKWWRLFKARNTDVVSRTPSLVESQHADSRLDEEQWRDFFAEASKALAEVDYDDRYIWNMDETSFHQNVSAASPICSDFQTFCPDWLHFGHFLCFGGIAASQLSHRIFPIYF